MKTDVTVTELKRPNPLWFIGSIIGKIASTILQVALSIVKSIFFKVFFVLLSFCLPFLVLGGALWWFLRRQAEGETVILTAIDADKKEYTTHDGKKYTVTNPPENFTVDQLPAKVQFYYKSMAIQFGVDFINKSTPLTISKREGFKVLEQNVTVPASPADAADDGASSDVASLLTSAASL